MKMNELLNENENDKKHNFYRPGESPLPERPYVPPKGTPAVDRKNGPKQINVKDIPELMHAAQLLQAGKISKEEFWEIADHYKAIFQVRDLPEPTTTDRLRVGLKGSEQLDRINYPIEDGERVKLRLDIPAYRDNDVWAATIHVPKWTNPETGKVTANKAISYRGTAVINDVTLEMKGNQMLQIATNQKYKTPIITAMGTWENKPEDEIVAEARAAMTSDEWVQIGCDPARRSFFYNRNEDHVKFKEPVVSGDRVIQINNLLLIKNAQYGDKNDYIYEDGLSDIYAALDEEIMKELTFHGSKCTKDCSGHRAGWQWARAKQATSSASHSQSFNNGANINIHQRSQGKNLIGPSIRNDKGKFQKFTPGRTQE